MSDPAAEARAEVIARPAYDAAGPGRWRDWWTLLHPPYTAWHLAYVVIGASLAPHVRLSTLLATLLAFFLAVGLAAHALDEYHGRPLRTQIPGGALLSVAVVALAGAVGLGVVGVSRVGWVLVPFLLAGPLLVVAYNAELFGGIVHTDAGFAAAWGAFPLLTSYVAQAGAVSAGSALAAAGAFAFSAAQRSLSTPGPADPAPRDERHRGHQPYRRQRAAGRRRANAGTVGAGPASPGLEHRAPRSGARHHPAGLKIGHSALSLYLTGAFIRVIPGDGTGELLRTSKG